MELKEKLEIVLVTYNRKKYLAKTLESLFAEGSPVKNLDITILDNLSTDGTSELIDSYAKRFSNLKHVIHNINIGGNGNISRGFEVAKKPYVWVMCDDDYYDWPNFFEIEKAIDEGYDLVGTMNFDYTEKNKLAMIFYHFSFLPAFITKKENITNTVIDNMFNNVCNMFPHLSVVAKCINEDRKIFIPEKSTVIQGTEVSNPNSYLKGVDKNIFQRKKEMFWFVGYLNSTQLITDPKKRDAVVCGLRHHMKSFTELLYLKLKLNKVQRDGSLRNLCDIYCSLNWYQRFLMLFFVFVLELRFLLYRKIFKHPVYIEEWEDYFNYIKQEKKIKSAIKKLKGKKVLVYGAGLLAEALFKNYDFSALNIVAVSDKKFKEKTDYKGFTAVPFEEMKNIDYDEIVYFLYRTVEVKNALKELGVNSDGDSILKKSKFVWV